MWLLINYYCYCLWLMFNYAINSSINNSRICDYRAIRQMSNYIQMFPRITRRSLTIGSLKTLCNSKNYFYYEFHILINYFNNKVHEKTWVSFYKSSNNMINYTLYQKATNLKFVAQNISFELQSKIYLMHVTDVVSIFQQPVSHNNKTSH